jgi:hypothetical protein
VGGGGRRGGGVGGGEFELTRHFTIQTIQMSATGNSNTFL